MNVLYLIDFFHFNYQLIYISLLQKTFLFISVHVAEREEVLTRTKRQYYLTSGLTEVTVRRWFNCTVEA